MGDRKTERNGDYWKSTDSRGNPIIGKNDWGSDHAHIAKDGSWGGLKSTRQAVKKTTYACPRCEARKGRG